MSVDLTVPASSAAATTKGLMVEPGSKVSVMARLRILKVCRLSRALGLYEGVFTIAKTSPV